MSAILFFFFLSLHHFIFDNITHYILCSFVEISCVSNGTVAEKLYENWFSSTAKVVVCVLQLWRNEWGEGQLFFNLDSFIGRCLKICYGTELLIFIGCLSYITNFEECLDNLFDPRIP